MPEEKEKTSKSKDKDVSIFRDADPVNIQPFSDARVEELEKVLGVPEGKFRSLITNNLDEIIARQKVNQWITDHSWRISCFIETIKGDSRDRSGTLPEAGHPFFSYFEQLEKRKTAFWHQLDDFKVLSRLTPIPPRLQELIDEINENSERYYQDELELAYQITNDLRRALVVEGILRFRIKKSDWGSSDPARLNILEKKGIADSWNVSDLFCVGVKEFIDAKLETYNPLWSIKIGKIITDFINNRRINKFRHLHQVKSTPAAIACDIAEFLNKLLTDNRRVSEDVDWLSLDIAYRLDESGLKIRIIGYNFGLSEKSAEDEKIPCPRFGTYPEVGGLVNSYRVERYEGRVASSIKKLKRKGSCTYLRNWLHNQSGSEFAIETKRTFEQYSVPSLSKINARYQEQIQEILRWQKKIEKAFLDIHLMYKTTKKLQEMADSICLPTAVSNGNIFLTKNMLPIRLYGKKAMYPFGEFSVNGQIVNLTGPNNSGKSTAMMTVFDDQIMFQAGLYILAKEAKMSAKDQIFLSFLERQTNESTFKLKLLKDNMIVDSIKQMNEEQRKHTIVFIDEMGSATTEGSVLPIVKKFVDWLAKQGVSVVMSTQIPDLSHYVGEKFGAMNYIVNDNYGFDPGIGEGEPEKIAKEIGFLESLAN